MSGCRFSGRVLGAVSVRSGGVSVSWIRTSPSPSWRSTEVSASESGRTLWVSNRGLNPSASCIRTSCTNGGEANGRGKRRGPRCGGRIQARYGLFGPRRANPLHHSFHDADPPAPRGPAATFFPLSRRCWVWRSRGCAYGADGHSPVVRAEPGSSGLRRDRLRGRGEGRPASGRFPSSRGVGRSPPAPRRRVRPSGVAPAPSRLGRSHERDA